MLLACAVRWLTGLGGGGRRQAQLRSQLWLHNPVF